MINSAGYILNRTGPSREQGKTPYEVWYGKPPGVKHIRIIGSTCYIHEPKVGRKKMDKKAAKSVLIGFDHDKGYRVWCLEKHKVI